MGKGTRPLFYVLLEHILQLLEEALALFVVLFFQSALELLQGVALGLAELLGDLDLAPDVHIAPAPAIQVLDALAPQAEGGTALGTCLLYTSDAADD